MNSIHKDRLRTLSEDEIALKALEVLFTEAIEAERPRIKDNADNRVVGEQYRAYEKAREILMTALNSINSHKKERREKTSFNKGR